MTIYIMDIETNQMLLPTPTPEGEPEVLMIGILNTKTRETLSLIHDLEDPNQLSLKWQSFLATLTPRDIIVGHNLHGFDLPFLKRHGFPVPTTPIVDTLLLSFFTQGQRRYRHSLKSWGIDLGILKSEMPERPPYTPLTQDYLQQVATYCAQDLLVTEALLNHLMEKCGSLIYRAQSALTMEGRLSHRLAHMALCPVPFKESVFDENQVALDQQAKDENYAYAMYNLDGKAPNAILKFLKTNQCHADQAFPRYPAIHWALRARKTATAVSGFTNNLKPSVLFPETFHFTLTAISNKTGKPGLSYYGTPFYQLPSRIKNHIDTQCTVQTFRISGLSDTLLASYGDILELSEALLLQDYPHYMDGRPMLLSSKTHRLNEWLKGNRAILWATFLSYLPESLPLAYVDSRHVVFSSMDGLSTQEYKDHISDALVKACEDYNITNSMFYIKPYKGLADSLFMESMTEPSIHA